MSLPRYAVPTSRTRTFTSSHTITPPVAGGAAPQSLGAPTAASITAAVVLVTAPAAVTATSAAVSAAAVLVTAPTGLGTPTAASTSTAAALASAPTSIGAPSSASITAASVLATAPALLTATAAGNSAATASITARALLTASSSSVSAATASITTPALLSAAAASTSSATATIQAGAPQLNPTAASISAVTALITAKAPLNATSASLAAASALVTAKAPVTATASSASAAAATITTSTPAVRQLGNLIVTTQGVIRPTGQAHTRALGTPTTLGRDLQPTSLTHTRAQGNPTLSARALPPSLTHTRTLSPIYVNSIRTPALDRGNQYPNVILADTPAGYWRLDEPTGTLAADTSGHNLNGLYQGSPILGSPSLLASDADASAKFNGTTQNVDITGNPAALQLASGTVECWVSPTGHNSGFTGIVSKNGAYFLGFNVNTNTLATFDFHNSVARVSGTTLTNGTIYHLVLTFQSGVTNGTQIWVNGVSVLTTTITVQSQANDLTLASNTPGTQDYPGTLDEVAVYNYVLTPTQIAAHYATGISATTRAQGTPNTTTQGVIRPTGQAHARAQGNPTAHGRQIITTTALDHTRSQGNPTLSGRALPPGIVHARALGSPEINLRVLAPLALSRA